MQDKNYKVAENLAEDFLAHYGVMGMKWGVRNDIAGKAKSKIVENAYAVTAKVQPREHLYSVKRRALTKENIHDKALVDIVNARVKETGILPTDDKILTAINREGIRAHKEAVYDNLSDNDIKKFKKYTDAAVYSRTVNTYLATGEPPHIGEKAEALKDALSKNKINDQIVYRSTNLKFTTDGISKKVDTNGEEIMKKTFSAFDKNFKGKSFKENRVYSTSTSPSFAIDTWRKVNPNAAKTYNSYLVINCKSCPGILADGRTSSGKKLVNTRSNQEGILAPNKMTYKKLSFDEERNMFAIYMDAE